MTIQNEPKNDSKGDSENKTDTGQEITEKKEDEDAKISNKPQTETVVENEVKQSESESKEEPESEKPPEVTADEVSRERHPVCLQLHILYVSLNIVSLENV